MESAAPEPSEHLAAATRLDARDTLGLFVAFGAVVLAVYRVALHGPFVSDDVVYYVHNPAVASLAAENLISILDPRSEAHFYAHNYAPLHLLLVAAERQLFGSWMAGYHAVNLLSHVLNAVLVVALLLSSRIPRSAAILGGAMFALHPAQVDAVAWISQLKSTACLSLALASLLCLFRHPVVSTVLFGLALLAKFSAVAFLPAAAVFAWARGAPRSTWIGLGGWLGVLLAVAAAQWAAFASGGAYELEVFANRFEQLRSMVAIGARYLWMAGTGLGLSAFHEPEPARSLWNPWWLVGAACGAVLIWRTATTLWRREEEAAYWVLAAASFLPVSQIVAFRYPMADRYLYFMLPGLVGGSWFVVIATCRWLAERSGRRAARAVWRTACAGAALLAVLFGFQAAARAPLWLSEANLIADAARHHPGGSHGYYLRAVRAARAGDVEGAVAELRRLEERKRLSLAKDFDRDPWLAPIHGEPAFREFVRETARYRIELVRRRGLRPGEHAVVALKHATLGDYDTAIELVEEAIREGAPRRAELLQLLDDLRARRRAERDTGPRE